MLWLFQAGFVAAYRQLIAVTSVALAVLILVSDDLNAQRYLSIGSNAEASQLLTWTYLLIALGLAGTCNRAVTQSAERIHLAFRAIRFPPGLTPEVLAFQMGLATVMLVVLMLRMAPEPIVELGRHFGYVAAAEIAWAGAMSIGIAYFGACTHAVLKVR
jgi:hypothetical protein